MALQRTRRIPFTSLIIGVASLGGTIACGGGEDQDINKLIRDLDKAEVQLAQQSETAANVRVTYAPICERVGRLCLDMPEDTQRCSEIAQRCDSGLAQHCGAPVPSADGGPAPDSGSIQDDAGAHDAGSAPGADAGTTDVATSDGGTSDGDPSCAAQDAHGEGLCKMAMGYAWDGKDCTMLGGCSCQGSDCDQLFAGQDACLEAYAHCQDPAPCYKGGCSGQLCSDSADLVSTCEWQPEYGCYRQATCERQADGKCGWTQTDELQQCIEEARKPDCRTLGCESKSDYCSSCWGSFQCIPIGAAC